MQKEKATRTVIVISLMHLYDKEGKVVCSIIKVVDQNVAIQELQLRDATGGRFRWDTPGGILEAIMTLAK